MATPPDGFLNVDLEIGARTRTVLAPLLEAFEATMFELHRGRMRGLYRAHFEVLGCTGDASETIHELAAAVEALRGPARRAWKAATVRDFNIGAELAIGVRSIELPLEADAVRRVIALGGRIVFTAYQEAAMRKPPRRTRR